MTSSILPEMGEFVHPNMSPWLSTYTTREEVCNLSQPSTNLGTVCPRASSKRLRLLLLNYACNSSMSTLSRATLYQMSQQHLFGTTMISEKKLPRARGQLIAQMALWSKLQCQDASHRSQLRQHQKVADGLCKRNPGNCWSIGRHNASWLCS